MHRILFELRDNQAAAAAGFLLSFIWIYTRGRPLSTVKELVIACLSLLLGVAGAGWMIYLFAYSSKVFLTEPALSVNWDLALSYFTGGRGIYPIRTYGIAMMAAFSVNMILITRRAPREGLDRNTIFNACVACIIGTLLGGRILFVVTQWEKFAQEPLRLVKFWEGGLVFYGGAIGTFVAVAIYIRGVRREKFLPYPDIMAPYAGIGLAIHRGFGCFMNGCCYGRPTTMPWGLRFPMGLHSTNTYGASAYLHPTQLYEVANGLSIALVLFLFRPHRKYYGQTTGIMLMMYAVNRYVIEFFRGDNLRGQVGRFSTSQFIGFIIFGLGLLLLVYAQVTKKEVFRLEKAEEKRHRPADPEPS